MSAHADLLTAFEIHSPEKIRAALDDGADTSALSALIEMYTRSSRFAAYIRVMLKAGARFDHPLLECILLDDAAGLRSLLAAEPAIVGSLIDLKCTFTPLRAVTPLHLAAEYNSVHCAQVLLNAGADVNAISHHDGHTPLFHTVNSNANFSRPSMELLVNAGARLDVQVQQLIWGEGFEWETALFDLTPVSYAQCGLLPQFHRQEAEIYANISWLWERKHGTLPALHNVPNRYLRKSKS